MAGLPRLVGYGVLVWLIPFAVAFAAFSFRESNRALFESIMAVALAIVVTVLAHDLLRRLSVGQLRAGLIAGIVWMAISVAIDLPLMLPAPVAMPLGAYLADIGLTYLMIPVITTGIGAAFARSARRPG